ncbi:MAG TPA: alpha/beta hydrolase-fold protein [Blastocatellia bacterium]|nr:alpha/beta hydrolase-fold protein [Blastocatellia bacterium]
MLIRRAVLSTIIAAVGIAGTPRTQTAALRFEIAISPRVSQRPVSGRLFVVLSKSPQPEPRLSIGEPGMNASPVFAKDVEGLVPAKSAVIDDSAAAFPIQSVSQLPAGEYFVQALLDSNIDLRSVNAPGNLYSAPRKIVVDRARPETIKLDLSEQVPPEKLPGNSEYLRFEKLESPLLSKFHGRPIFLRAGIILPRDYDKQPQRHYSLVVRIGGYGSKFTEVASLMAESSPFRKAWLAEDLPPMILLQLDGDGPLGDCYQVNSDNNGPYGDAITTELIPFIERKYRGIGNGHARVLTGGSTGGWVSLALQVFYPDFFNGTWSGFPDGVDFRAFQLVNIYEDENAYVNRFGFERPSARTLLGDTLFTIRHECQMENVMGRGDSWTMSGEQWGAWNAVYGPRGSDGRPIALWDPKTGKIDRRVVAHWKKYDLRLVLEENWKALGPKLRGKLHIWVGEADDYFLNNAVHLLEGFLAKAEPAYEGSILYGPGKGHGWMPFNYHELLRQMSAAVDKSEAR